MRDIIWTLIVVWFIYKIVDVFRSSTAKHTANNNPHSTHETNTNFHNNPKPEQDIKNAVKKHLNNEGEYIDFEEVK